MLYFLQTLSLLLPVFAGGISLIVVIKKNLLPFMDTPVDGGARFSGKPLFGANKTWRGITVHVCIATAMTAVLWALSFMTGAVHSIYHQNPILLGIAFAMSYIAGELVNSFIKRRLGIGVGVSRTRPQHFFDTTDGIIVVAIMLFAVYGVPFMQVALATCLAVLVHLGTDLLMQQLGLKKR